MIKKIAIALIVIGLLFLILTGTGVLNIYVIEVVEEVKDGIR